MKGRTSVVIAHHLDTIRHADVIFVIKDCGLAEQGTHDALMAQNGVYAELYRIQTPSRSRSAPADRCRAVSVPAARSDTERKVSCDEPAMKPRCALLMLVLLAALSAGVTGAAGRPRRPDRPTPPGCRRGSGGIPATIASLDLINGAGGKAHAPDPTGTFTFVKEDTAGIEPEVRRHRRAGRHVEGQARGRVAARDGRDAVPVGGRLLHRRGLLTSPSSRSRACPPCKRGRELRVRRRRRPRRPPRTEARATARSSGTGTGSTIPFVGQRELNGLRVMMALLNSWDLKAINNAVYEVNGERHYVVSDVGATFGKTGDALTRTKGMPRDYEDSKFIANVTPDFDRLRAPQPPAVPWRPRRRQLPRAHQDGDRSPSTSRAPTSSGWRHRLSLLTDRQIRDGFRAAGFDAERRRDTDETRSPQRAIAALGSL